MSALSIVVRAGAVGRRVDGEGAAPELGGDEPVARIGDAHQRERDDDVRRWHRAVHPTTDRSLPDVPIRLLRKRGSKIGLRLPVASKGREVGSQQVVSLGVPNRVSHLAILIRVRISVNR